MVIVFDCVNPVKVIVFPEVLDDNPAGKVNPIPVGNPVIVAVVALFIKKYNPAIGTFAHT